MCIILWNKAASKKCNIGKGEVNGLWFMLALPTRKQFNYLVMQYIHAEKRLIINVRVSFDVPYHRPHRICRIRPKPPKASCRTIVRIQEIGKKLLVPVTALLAFPCHH